MEATGIPADCQTSYSGSFEIQVVNTTESKRSLEKRQGALSLTLADSVLKDSQDRIAYIAADHQFQFDNPVPDDTIYASGWAICPDKTLVLGSDHIFQQCLSGNFYNLYDDNDNASCSPVNIYVIEDSSSTSTTAVDSVSAAAASSTITSKTTLTTAFTTLGQTQSSRSDPAGPTSATSSSNPATSSPMQTASPSSGHQSSGTNVGAIAGGVVGGVAGLALIAGIIWYLVRRKEKQKQPAVPEMQRFPVDPQTSY